MRNAILTWLLLVTIAGANPAGFHEGRTAARLRGNAGVVSDAWAAAGLNTGLVEYWAMRTNGTAVIAEYGTNTGTAVNGVLFGSAYGKRDEGAFLDRSNDYISLFATSNAITASGISSADGTFSAWISPTNVAASRCVFAVTDQANNDNRFALYLTPGHNMQILWRGGSATTLNNIQSVATVPTNGFSHVAFVSTGSAYLMYINGVSSALTAVSGTDNGRWISTAPNVHVAAIGVEQRTTPINYYGGLMDEVSIWSRALSSTEIYLIGNTNNPLYAPYKP
jgi:hypothetical protein